MNIVITMGGNGRRFREKGYDAPKYMIKVKNKTLFEWSMISLESFKSVNPKYIFVVKREDNAKEFIEKEIEKLNIKNASIVEIDKITDGQATTVVLAKEKWIEGEALLIYNIDTHIEPHILKPEDIQGDGFIPCFNAPGENWSFVKLDENGNAVELREKKKISNNATIGLYYFSSTDLYMKAYNEYYSEQGNLEKGEKYIAPLYNYLIKENYIVRISIIPFENVHVIGTPEELEEFRNSDYYKI